MDQLELANRFDRDRRRLRSVAYRIVGSLSEADDAVQEAWLRLQRAEAEEIDNLEGWLTAVVARICLNILRHRRSHAEEPLDAFVPEPIISTDARDDPEHEALLADAVGIALQAVLDALYPAERLAFVLHDMFAVRFDEIAMLVERPPRRRASAGPRPGWSGGVACRIGGHPLGANRRGAPCGNGQGRERSSSHEAAVDLDGMRPSPQLPIRVNPPRCLGWTLSGTPAPACTRSVSTTASLGVPKTWICVVASSVSA
jgi:RNA polymerase sigma factor (sigma-70 family)